MTNTNLIIEKVDNAINYLKKGKLIIIADSENREAEGDMMGIAELVTPQTVNTMISHAHGLLCVPMSAIIAKQMALPIMVTNSNDAYGTAFTISTDAKTTSTGISAYDRAKTIKLLSSDKTKASDFYHPGHIFPLIAKQNGTFTRTGHTEAAIDMTYLAGKRPVAYICEIVKKDGHMTRRKDLIQYSTKYDMPIITVDNIIQYRKIKHINYINNDCIRPFSKVKLPTKYGNFILEGYKDEHTNELDLVIYKNKAQISSTPLVRLHSKCLTGEALGSLRCDCGPQLAESFRLINEQNGILVYLASQEGRGIGLENKLKAYALQDQGLDTLEANLQLDLPADNRNYSFAAKILKSKNINQIRLLTNNPDKIKQLENNNIRVIEQVPLEVGLSKDNINYLKTKKVKFHHTLKEV